MNPRSWALLALKVFGLYWMVEFSLRLVTLPMILNSFRSAPAGVSPVPMVVGYSLSLLGMLIVGLILLSRTDQIANLLFNHSLFNSNNDSPNHESLEVSAYGVAAVVIASSAIPGCITKAGPFFFAVKSSNWSIRELIRGYEQQQFLFHLLQLTIAVVLFAGSQRLAEFHHKLRDKISKVRELPYKQEEGPT